MTTDQLSEQPTRWRTLDEFTHTYMKYLHGLSCEEKIILSIIRLQRYNKKIIFANYFKSFDRNH